MKQLITIITTMLLLNTTFVFADCTADPSTNLGTINFSAITWTYSAPGDPCSNLTTASYTGDVIINAANGSTLTMDQSITINGDFLLTNQGTSTLYVPAGVTVTINGNLGDPTNNNFIYDIDGALIVSGTISGKNGNGFQGSGSVDAGGLDFQGEPTCVEPDCPSITASTCDPPGDFCTSALPIELTSFELDNLGNDVIISWETASEENNDYFTIERSNDGIEFEVINTQNAAGNSTISHSYSFIDKAPYYGLSYYRLTQTDYNGAKEVFPAHSIYLSSLSKVVIYPNPISADQRLTIYSNAAEGEEVRLSVFNSLGVEVINKVIQAGNNTIELTPQFKPGYYMFEVKSGSNNFQERILVK